MADAKKEPAIALYLYQGQIVFLLALGADALRAWLDSQPHETPAHSVIEVVVTTPSGVIRCVPDGVYLVERGVAEGGGA